ncbi:MAG: hypothetical protein ACI35S_09530 [Anaeroplasma sp.]
MDFFDEDRKQKDLDERIYNEKYEQQVKYSKKVFFILFIVFFILSLIFLFLGLLLTIYEIAYCSIIYVVVGIIFLIIGFVLPKKGNYEKFKKRIKKYGYLNIYQLNAKVAILDEKNNILESKLKELEDEIRKLK